MRLLKLLFIVIILIKLDVVFASTGADFSPSPLINYASFTLDNIPVCECRIFQVDATREVSAIEVLNGRDFSLLTPNQINILFGNKKINPQDIFELEKKSAEVYARERAGIAKSNPENKSHVRIAKTYRDYADYLKNLNSVFYPYLVKAKAYSKPTGSYSISLNRDVLDVYHGSLGHGGLQLHDEFIVVFVEREINSVKINAGQIE